MVQRAFNVVQTTSALVCRCKTHYFAFAMSIDALKTLFRRHFGKSPDKIEPLKGDGSDRRLYRLSAGEETVIGVFGANRRENDAFVHFSRHFKHHGLPVPHIYCYDAEKGVYLESDLGDVTLFDYQRSCTSEKEFSRLYLFFRKAIALLPHFQIVAGTSVDTRFCYQTEAFDAEAMIRDLLYFEHSFVRRFCSQWPTAQSLREDFSLLIDRLLEADDRYFLYRDFQTRNIMIHEQKLYFIDYQSGRRGALQYDPASLLYDANAALTEPLRDELLQVYLNEAARHVPMFETSFMKYFYDFALIRIFQVLAAFCFLTYEKKKPYFLTGVPSALRNLYLIAEKSSAFRSMRVLPHLIFDRGLESRVKEALVASSFS